MGTRSLTVFKDIDEEICVMYRQMDGYPDGHGKELTDFLDGMLIINGIGGDAKEGTHANGMSCLTAQVIAHFKNEFGIGGVYIYPAGTRDAGEEYIYTVSPGEAEDRREDRKVTVEVFEVYENKTTKMI